MGDEFADEQVRGVFESGRLTAGGIGVGEELLEVTLVAALGVRRGVALEAQVVEEFFDGLFHSTGV